MRGTLTDYNVVRKTFEECGLELLSDSSKYETCHTKLEYICKHHRNLGVQFYSYYNVRKRLDRGSCGCPACSKEINEHKYISGIYMITNTVNNKKYIGQSWDIMQRWTIHRTSLNGGYHHNPHLQHAWTKYGEDKFTFEILTTCTTQDEMNEAERDYIKKYNSANQDYGYNDELGGNGAGKKTDEFKKQMSLKKRGVKSDFSADDVRHIKMAIYLGIDRKEIFEMYNTNRAVVTAICTGQTFSYILPELTQYTKNIGKYYRDIRRKEILDTYDELKSISEVHKKLGYSMSVIEKTVYENRKVGKVNKYIQIYDEVFRLHEEGIINYEIAKRLNISPSTVERYLTGQNIPGRKPSNKKINNEIEIQIIDYYKSGMTLGDIGSIFDISETSVRYVINKYKNIENYYEELKTTLLF